MDGRELRLFRDVQTEADIECIRDFPLDLPPEEYPCESLLISSGSTVHSSDSELVGMREVRVGGQAVCWGERAEGTQLLLDALQVIRPWDVAY